MKTRKSISLILITGLVFSILISCETNPDVTPQNDLLPEKFTVDIPQAISYDQNAAGGRTDGRVHGDTLKGNHIYQHLGTFIAIGKGASKLIEEIIQGIRKHRIDRVMTLTYTADKDNRAKNLTVLSDVTFEGISWEYQLTVTDADSESQADGGKALQVFWNKTGSVKGIAIIKPYNIDRGTNLHAKDAVFRIDYSEDGTLGYDAHMEVRIAGLPLNSPLTDPFSMNTLRMFAGKKGDVVDVYGNSNHPNAVLFSGKAGINWAFVASGSDPKAIGVAEVGLPPSTLSSSDRTVLLKEYSIKNVLKNHITAAWPGIDPILLDGYLSTTAAPGYFTNSKGFIAGGVSPGAEWTVLAQRLDTLTPYSPLEVSNLAINFK